MRLGVPDRPDRFESRQLEGSTTNANNQHQLKNIIIVINTKAREPETEPKRLLFVLAEAIYFKCDTIQQVVVEKEYFIFV